jgi:hypothetical protein
MQSDWNWSYAVLANSRSASIELWKFRNYFFRGGGRWNDFFLPSIVTPSNLDRPTGKVMHSTTANTPFHEINVQDISDFRFESTNLQNWELTISRRFYRSGVSMKCELRGQGVAQCDTDSASQWRQCGDSSTGPSCDHHVCIIEVCLNPTDYLVIRGISP